ncbi:DMT family transporter [Algihabitans albus]|uniref:DMT family transporter n=1 Tax=Algihabitans albus TaxID=2164067 RepID=UPI000E5D9577|nr:DMT family transporter [Algihabitans albus]
MPALVAGARKLSDWMGGNAYLLLILTAAAWGGNAVAGRFAVGEVSPMALVALRWVGVVLLVLIFARRQMVSELPVLRVHWRFMALLGTIGFTIFNALFYTAAQTTTAINIGILQGSIPVFVLIGAFLLDRTPVTPLQMLGVAVTTLGVVTVTAAGELQRLLQMSFAEGDLIMLVACGFYAAYTVALRRRPKVSGLAMFSVMAFAAFLAALPLAVAEAAAGAFVWPSLTGWAVVAFVMVFPSFLAQLSFMQGVKLIGPGRAGVFVNLVPIFAALFSVLLLGETFALFHAVALVLVLGGIWIAERAKSRQS